MLSFVFSCEIYDRKLQFVTFCVRKCEIAFTASDISLNLAEIGSTLIQLRLHLPHAIGTLNASTPPRALTGTIPYNTSGGLVQFPEQ